MLKGSLAGGPAMNGPTHGPELVQPAVAMDPAADQQKKKKGSKKRTKTRVTAAPAGRSSLHSHAGVGVSSQPSSNKYR